VQDEERALEVIRCKVMEQMLPMAILDAEYQVEE
jgi:cell fate regulator YaaT (PSP1 superfamily)